MGWTVELNLETAVKATLLRKPQWSRFCNCGLEILKIREFNRLPTSASLTRLTGDGTLMYDSSAEEVV